MERKFLKNIRSYHSITRTGVGGANSSNQTGMQAFGIDARAREIAYLKRVRLTLGHKIPGAAWAYEYYFMLKRQATTASLVSDSSHPDNTILQMRYTDSDSYAQVAQPDRASPQLPLEWEWPEGFEPVLLDTPWMLQYLYVELNAGAFVVTLSFSFDFWIEKPTEKEYEKLKLRYGNLG